MIRQFSKIAVPIIIAVLAIALAFMISALRLRREPRASFQQAVKEKVFPSTLYFILKTNVATKQSARHYSVNIDTLPPEIKALRPAGATVYVASEPQESYFSLVFGGGFGHWGIVVGGGAFTPVSSQQISYDKWTNNIWFFQEL